MKKHINQYPSLMDSQGEKKEYRPNYFEGVLQLRNPTDEVFNMIHNQIAHDERAYISKEVYYKNGVDLYLSSNRFLLRLGRKLKQSYKGKLIVSRRIFTTDKFTSKFVYRVTVLFSLEPKRLDEESDGD
ncbi:hypothetical protein HYU13_00735 [Candidatus Woesearchaeota archaeon]|nr:hypothetical protein [Candidatus Woesearchaeota archaeon]